MSVLFLFLVTSEPSLQVGISTAYVVITVGNRRLNADFATSVETSRLGKIASAINLNRLIEIERHPVSVADVVQRVIRLIISVFEPVLEIKPVSAVISRRDRAVVRVIVRITIVGIDEQLLAVVEILAIEFVIDVQSIRLRSQMQFAFS